MDLKQLQYFVVSVDCGSFKKAAESLYTSQPHISKTIKSLEAELDLELLQRKARGVEVTPAGKKVYEYACRVLTEAGKILSVQDTKDVRTLKIAANASDQLARLFQDFYMQEQVNGLHAQYMEYGLEAVLQALHHHVAELGCVYIEEKQLTPFRQMLERKHLEFVELGRMSPFLYVGPKSPFYQASWVTSKNLGEISYVQLSGEETMNIDLIQSKEDYRYHRRHGQVMVTNSRHLLTQMLLETELGNISCGIVPEENAKEGIHAIPIKGTENSILFGYVKRRRDGLSSEADRFVSYLLKWFSSCQMGRICVK